MRVLSIWILIALLAAPLLLFILEEEPLSATEILEQACSYKAVEEAVIVEREYYYAPVWSIQGIYYWDAGTIKLSGTDAEKLSMSLPENQSFEKKEFNGNSFYEMNVVGKKSSSCDVKIETNTLNYRLSLS
ncbi:hypothetical protein ACFL48_04275 [Pseudomonadota bacterium]